MIWLIRILLTIGLVALFGWTAWQNIVLPGVFEAHYDFDQTTPFITSLTPGDRVEPITRNARGVAYQTVIDDPTYFRIRAPRSFEQAKITMRFKNESDHPFSIGGLVSWEEYQFDFKSLEETYQDKDWQVATVEFDLTRLLTTDGRTYTFALSLPGITETGNKVQIESIWVRLEREPQTIKELVTSLWLTN